eukprot:scaffold5986_cov128-Isochrysis_galbana.AAC.7
MPAGRRRKGRVRGLHALEWWDLIGSLTAADGTGSSMTWPRAKNRAGDRCRRAAMRRKGLRRERPSQRQQAPPKDEGMARTPPAGLEHGLPVPLRHRGGHPRLERWLRPRPSVRGGSRRERRERAHHMRQLSTAVHPHSLSPTSTPPLASTCSAGPPDVALTVCGLLNRREELRRRRSISARTATPAVHLPATDATAEIAPQAASSRSARPDPSKPCHARSACAAPPTAALKAWYPTMRKASPAAPGAWTAHGARLNTPVNGGFGVGGLSGHWQGTSRERRRRWARQSHPSEGRRGHRCRRPWCPGAGRRLWPPAAAARAEGTCLPTGCAAARSCRW